MHTDSIVLKIRAEYESLSRTNKKIANYILNDTERFLKETSHEIADKAGVSSASVIRFARLIGFEGLEAFKRQLSADTLFNETAKSLDLLINSNSSVHDIVGKTQSIITGGVRDLFYQIDEEALATALEALRKANTVYLVGTGASALACYDLYHAFNRVNKRAVFNLDSHLTMEFLNFASEEDLLISISYGGNSMEAVYCAEIAKARGTKVIAITCNKPSRLANLADIKLTVPYTESSLRVSSMTSKINTLIVVDLLYLGYINPDLDSHRENLINTNKLVRKLKV